METDPIGGRLPDRERQRRARPRHERATGLTHRHDDGAGTSHRRDEPRRRPAQGPLRRGCRSQRHLDDGRDRQQARHARAAARGAADASNPRGFSEPQWVVDLHERFLKEVAVQSGDARPAAWFETGRISTREPARIRVTDWLEPHFDVHPELVVKDPRLSWFLGLWRVAAIRTGAKPVFVDDAAPAGRGRRQQAEVLRQQARLGPPGRELAQHAAPHRARHARGSRHATASSCATRTC